MRPGSWTGAALALGAGVLAAARPAAKPLHPVGVVVEGRLERHGSPQSTGVGWLDAVGEDPVVVRLSRAIGLPGRLPDIHGLAMRVDRPDGGDLLFASTGLGRLTRFILIPSVRAQDRPLTTLLPYRTSTGPLLLAVVARDELTYDLSWARPGGSWRSFAVLHLPTTVGADRDLSFDPVRRQIPGLGQYPWVVRLREPAYRTARHSRSPRRSVRHSLRRYRDTATTLPGGS